MTTPADVLYYAGFIFLVLVVLSFLVEKVWHPYRRRQNDHSRNEQRDPATVERERSLLLKKKQDELDEQAQLLKKKQREEEWTEILRLQEMQTKLSNSGKGHVLKRSKEVAPSDASFGALERRKKRADPLEMERILREEQDLEFQLSLQQDIEKERELERTRRQAKEEEVLKKAQELKKKEDKQARLARVPPEPKKEETVGVCSFAIRLPNGERMNRRFYNYNTVQDVIDFVATRPNMEAKEFQLVTTIPRVVYSNPTLTIADAGIVSNMVLTTEEL